MVFRPAARLAAGVRMPSNPRPAKRVRLCRCVAQLRGSGPRGTSGGGIVGWEPVNRSALWNRPHRRALLATQIHDASEGQCGFHHCEALALEAHRVLRLRTGGG